MKVSDETDEDRLFARGGLDLPDHVTSEIRPENVLAPPIEIIVSQLSKALITNFVPETHFLRARIMPQRFGSIFECYLGVEVDIKPPHRCKYAILLPETEI